MAAQPQPLRPEEEPPGTGVSRDSPPPRRDGGRWLQRLIILALVAVGGWFGVQEVRDRMIYVDEIDSRIVGELITISSRVDGWLAEITIEAGETISRGQVLARIDARESELLVRELKARAEGVDSERRRMLAERDLIDLQTRTRLETQLSTASAAQATVTALDPQLELALAELERSESLFEKRVIPKQQLEQTRATARRIEGEHRGAKAEYQEAVARLEEARAERSRLKVLDEELDMLGHRREALLAQLAQQQLDLEDRLIRAPIDGVVDKTFVEAGEYVRAGQRLAIVHDPGRIWVETNIKETDIARLAVGQTVTVTVDAYPDARISGRVESIGSSTTASYALLPNPNPSGNFTKVTQRLPVRIALDTPDTRLHPGMMVEIRIHVGGR